MKLTFQNQSGWSPFSVVCVYSIHVIKEYSTLCLICFRLWNIVGRYRPITRNRVNTLRHIDKAVDILPTTFSTLFVVGKCWWFDYFTTICFQGSNWHLVQITAWGRLNQKWPHILTYVWFGLNEFSYCNTIAMPCVFFQLCNHIDYYSNNFDW